MHLIVEMIIKIDLKVFAFFIQKIVNLRIIKKCSDRIEYQKECNIYILFIQVIIKCIFNENEYSSLCYLRLMMNDFKKVLLKTNLGDEVYDFENVRVSVILLKRCYH